MISFKEEFYKAIQQLYPNGPEWDLVGIITRSSKVYTLSYDSKILSGIFEILTEPIIQKIADNNNLELRKGVQNQYPEFTLFDDITSQQKIAIDMKSTYRQFNVGGDVKPYSFTLGSYRSYLQDPKGTKGILFPYSDYKEHWVIGFVYDRNPGYKNVEIMNIIEASQLQAPYSNIEYFVQEKHKISGKVAGSGNTTNIGSIKSKTIKNFVEGNGPFQTKEEFENYWRNFIKQIK
jgi:Restriction endonuclease EcoRV